MIKQGSTSPLDYCRKRCNVPSKLASIDAAAIERSVVLRKVRSLDCVRLPLEIKGEWIYLSNNSALQELKASRFSTQARKSKLSTASEDDEFPSVECKIAHIARSDSIRPIPTTEFLSPSTSSSSLAALAGNDDQYHNIFSSFFSLVNSNQGFQSRIGRLLNATIFLLFVLASLADITSRYRRHHAAKYKPDFVQLSFDSPYTSKAKGQGLLGSAMIESVTGALSPILPFAGGVDLRRNEYWSHWMEWFGLASTSTDRVKGKLPSTLANSETSRKGTATSTVTGIQRGGAQRSPFQLMVLSVSEPFISRENIAEMTLSDIALTFRYVVESGRPSFDVAEFYAHGDDGNPLSDSVRNILIALDEAVAKSRGSDVMPALTQSTTPLSMDYPLSPAVGYGDIDALQFCAAVRLLAEWRILRQVPEGYKGYSVGMSLGHKDIVQNLVKIENSVHEWIAYQMERSREDISGPDPREENECKNHSTIQIFGQGDREVEGQFVKRNSCIVEESIRSPTLRDLLSYEIHANIHPTNKLPRLKEKSAAMGLLWVRRQFHYQTSIFRNILKVPNVFSSALEAVSAAYSEVYGSLHGWAVQKIFQYSFQSAPDLEVIFRHMNPRLFNQVVLSATTGDYTSKSDSKDVLKLRKTETLEMPVDESDLFIKEKSLSECNTAKSMSHKEGINTTQESIGNIFNHLGSEWNKFGRHLICQLEKVAGQIGIEWQKIAVTSSRFFTNEISRHSSDKTQHPDPSLFQSGLHEARGGAMFASSHILKKTQGLSGEALEKYTTKEMTLDARNKINSFLAVAQPLLADLAGLFDEFNMDDPTKV